MPPQSDEPTFMSSDGHQPDASPGQPQNHHQYNGGTDRYREKQMLESRMSGELEGSTLGSSSRDGDRGSRGQRRTASSGGFLLDSSFMPRSKSLRGIYHRPRRSEPDRREKRDAPEPNITVPKKKSRFPWSRQKHAARNSSFGAVPSSSTAERQGAVPDSSNAQQLEEHDERGATADTEQAALDSDSVQIVNLALNLSESRKRTNLGRFPSNRLSGPKLPAYEDTQASNPMGSVGQQPSRARRSSAPLFANDNFMPSNLQQQQAPKGQPSLSNLIPDAGNGAAVPFKPSDNTLARADNARRHFELFAEYLRLLSFLPPLKGVTEHRSVTSDDASPSRAYNPLQSIRNRKIRFREKCPINTEAEGWNNVDNVRRWIDDIEEQCSHQGHSTPTCLELPPFHKAAQDPPGEPEDTDLLTVSPPSSLRQVSRISGAKTPRPRLDWLISPAELLSDAAWVEDSWNKRKIVDRDGRHVCPDPSELVPGNSSLDIPRSQKRSRLSKDQPAAERVSDTPAFESHRPMDIDFKRTSRGRQRHRLSSPPHSSSVFIRETGFKQDKPRLRSSSSSTASSAKDDYGTTVSSARVDRGKSPEAHVPGLLNLHIPRVKRPGEDKEEVAHVSPQGTGLSLYQSRKSVVRPKAHETKGSLSSAPSIDDLYSPRMSLEEADTSPVNSPSHAAFFPSITVNLSPPSSRSPSPPRRPFSRMRTPRHERSKSKSKNKKDSRDNGNDSPLHSESLGKRGPQEPPAMDHSGKLEPSPLPDRISSSYQEGQLPSELEGLCNTRPQKGLSPQDSRLRGFFKGRGKIAGLVGNEVSRVGDRILKKEPLADSRKSSAAVSLSSDDSDMDDVEETKGESKPSPRTSLRRLPTDESYRMPRGHSERGAAKRSVLSLPTFASPLRRQDVEDKQAGASGVDSPYERDPSPLVCNAGTSQGKITSLPVDRPDEGFAFNRSVPPALEKTKGGQINDPSVPFTLNRPPVTGLTQAKASPGPSSRERRPGLSGPSRSWSISDRSLSALADTGIPGKREIERTRALLLSSGIKAREIVRRAETARDPPPEFLRCSVGPNELAPRVARVHEFDVAAQRLLQEFERSQYLLQESMDRFSASTSSRLKSQLSSLESLANLSLSRRVRTVSDDAEDLSVQLHTTSTLAVKQLSDALDRGMRKRHRRLRWMRRAGFVVLEWALVGVLWWVWLIVMIFKLFRGILRGTVSGVRWILWI